ncbi:SH3 domain-containing protein [Alkalicella caledoniensis]|uniref:SH3 domain-containing protein n=1 Tax=Alkalicella caledoniensis TaxID=2731377 RepID=A0A7G9WAC9_ALKCA|nr:SH3 domain-containing protein [Alkalicella caledoniensis]QNO15641.1 SH3 domain-containing protein [Alkalicella caledoniensis]
MQKKYKIMIIALLVVTFSVVGASAAWMNTSKPGTADNPLVSQGYLDKVFSIFRSEVQSDLEAQQQKYDQLHNQYKGLEKELGDLKKVVNDLTNGQPTTPTNPTTPTTPTQPTNPTPPTSSAKATIVVDSSVVNFRSGNSTSDSVVETVRKGDEIVALKYSNEWIQGTFNNKTGWIAGWLVKSKSGHQIAYINSSLVNVRSGPGTNHSLVTQVRSGDIVRILSEQGDWCRVILPDGKEAWIFKPLLTRI